MLARLYEQWYCSSTLFSLGAFPPNCPEILIAQSLRLLKIQLDSCFRTTDGLPRDRRDLRIRSVQRDKMPAGQIEHGLNLSARRDDCGHFVLSLLRRVGQFQVPNLCLLEDGGRSRITGRSFRLIPSDVLSRRVILRSFPLSNAGGRVFEQNK